MSSLHTRAGSFVIDPMILVAACFCLPASAAAQAAQDTVRARLRDHEAWISGRLVRFDSVLVLDQAGRSLELQRQDLLQVQVYRRRSPLAFVALGAGVALAGYQVARWVAGPGSDWACDGCGITWHEDRDYLLFGAGGMALGAVVYLAWPPRWKNVLGP